ATSSVAFTVLKYIGAAYLIYLGIKLWRSKPADLHAASTSRRGGKLQFLEGVTLQLTNPKAVFFFLAVFPQFISYSDNFIAQFSLLVMTYSICVVAIHFLYAYMARHAQQWLSTDKGRRIVNRCGGGTFVCFGVGLAMTSK